jgi:hypothetical protein
MGDMMDKAANFFIPGRILIPKNTEARDMKLWSVIACDQFTSEPEYWERVESAVKGAPSTLRLMLPELYLRPKALSPRQAR